MKVEFIRELPVSSTGAKQCLVRREEKYYVVSSVNAFGLGFETLVFPADEAGKVTDWLQVAGGKGDSREEAISELEEAEEVKPHQVTLGDAVDILQEFASLARMKDV